MKDILSSETVKTLAQFATPTIANAIEKFDLRLRNEGYTDSSICNRISQQEAMVGFAATLQMRTSSPPVEGHKYHTRSDWWDSLSLIPSPWLMVIQDVDEIQGRGSVAGGIHANIFKALGGNGIITNGAIRDLDTMRSLGLHVYSGNITPSHAYAHIVDFGMPVKIGGLLIRPGDLLHGDEHGIISIPLQIAEKIPETAAEIQREEQKVIDFCNSSEFTIPKLRDLISKK